MTMPQDAVSGVFSFPKWVLGAFTIMFFGLAGFTYNSGIVNSRDIAVLTQKQQYSQQERDELRQDIRDLKVQLDRIEKNQSTQEQVQNFILENMAAIKKK